MSPAVFESFPDQDVGHQVVQVNLLLTGGKFIRIGFLQTNRGGCLAAARGQEHDRLSDQYQEIEREGERERDLEREREREREREI